MYPVLESEEETGFIMFSELQTGETALVPHVLLCEQSNNK
jgi:hypothetical protein